MAGGLRGPFVYTVWGLVYFDKIINLFSTQCFLKVDQMVADILLILLMCGLGGLSVIVKELVLANVVFLR